MTINERIKELRKEKNLTQVEFGERIGLKKSAANKLEQDGATVIDQNIRLICDTFHVREKWLRTGEGEKDAGSDEELWKKIRDKFFLHGFTEEIARAWYSLDDDKREEIADKVESIAQTLRANMEGSAARTKDDPAAVDIDQELADYEAELKAQAKEQSLSAGTSATEKRA